MQGRAPNTIGHGVLTAAKNRKAKSETNAYDEKWDVDYAADAQLTGTGWSVLRRPAARAKVDTKVPDWFLWSLFVIGLMLTVLVLLVLKFLRTEEDHDRDDEGDR